MTLSFIVETGATLEGTCVFVEGDYAFDFQVASPDIRATRTGNGAVTSFSARTLQLETGVETGIVLYAWGCLPKTSWQSGDVAPPEAEPGIVRYAGDPELVQGVSVRLGAEKDWSVTFDDDSGWLLLNRSGADSTRNVEVTTDVVLGLIDDQIVKIWLHPEFRQDA